MRLLGAICVAVLALGAAPASAATLCVQSTGTCDNDFITLQDAIDFAAADPVRDTIRIGPVDLVENAVVSASNPVDIVGAGRGTDGTVLSSPNTVFALDVQSAGSTVSNLRVRLSNVSGFGESGLGLSATGVVADGVTVVGEAGISNAGGVQVRTGATLRNSLVELPRTGNANYAINAEDDALVENVSAAGDAMLDARDAGLPVVVRRLRSTSPSTLGVNALGGGSVQISDSLIRLAGGSSSTGLTTENSFGGSPSIVARHLTLLGSGAPTQAGVGAFAGGYFAGQTSTIDLRDSLLHGLSTDLEVTADPGASARIPIHHSNFDPAKVVDTGGGNSVVEAGTTNLLANPGFVDAAAGDFRLRADSALVDRGFPGAGSTVDLDGQPRPNDGNGDGLAVRDIGAFEYQRPAEPVDPVAPDTAAPLFAIVSRGLKLDRRGRVAVVVRGPANETAASAGSLSLRSVRRLRVAAAQRARRVTFGRKGFSLAPNARTVVRLKLSRRNVRRVRALGRLRVRLAVTVRDSAGNARTLTKGVALRAARR